MHLPYIFLWYTINDASFDKNKRNVHVVMKALWLPTIDFLDKSSTDLILKPYILHSYLLGETLLNQAQVNICFNFVLRVWVIAFV